MRRARYDGVYTDGRNFYTLSKDRESVYGEKIVRGKGGVYHLWNPRRSKLAASMNLRLKTFPFRGSKVLYLGASTGTTVSHVSDLASVVWAVELSPVSMHKLLSLAERRKNIIPILEDARNVNFLSLFVAAPDVLYQDISQRDQVDIFLKNMEHFSPSWGFIMLKTRTIDMRLPPKEVMRQSKKKIEEHYDIKEVLNLSRFQKGHYAFVVIG